LKYLTLHKIIFYSRLCRKNNLLTSDVLIAKLINRNIARIIERFVGHLSAFVNAGIALSGQ